MFGERLFKNFKKEFFSYDFFSISENLLVVIYDEIELRKVYDGVGVYKGKKTDLGVNLSEVKIDWIFEEFSLFTYHIIKNQFN